MFILLRHEMSLFYSDTLDYDVTFRFQYLVSSNKRSYDEPHPYVISPLDNVTIAANETVANFTVVSKSAGKVFVGIVDTNTSANHTDIDG